MEVDLEPGDWLFLYTDGLIEAENSEGEEFGMERLESLLPELRGMGPEAIGTHILRHVDSFLGDARLTDDLSLAIMVRH